MGVMRDTLSKEKYDQFRIETWVKSFWAENRIYEKVKKASMSRDRKIYFLDGPPYASSNVIHPGTAWNKVVKDTLLRYYRMKGYKVWDKPGYDVHGLPIEVKIEKELRLKSKKDIVEKVGIANFINACKSFVDSNIRAMTEQFKEIGVFMDWENPYITYTNDYIEAGWWLIKRAHEKGLLYQGTSVVHWCPRCETTLADYEVSEYKMLSDPSIYVKMKVEGRENEYLVIWTTTPWTLPANAFIMAHPDLEYVKVEVGDEFLILAKARLEAVMKECGITEYEVVEAFKGKELEGLRYKHPLEDVVDAQRILAKYHQVVMAPEAVSAYEGTGLVHSAPGHGDVDFEIGSKLGVPAISLVGDDGRMTRDAGKYAGLYFRTEANEAIMRDLEERGALLHKSSVVHRYPVCWRCKTPLLLRATKQWMIKVTALREELEREAERIEWHPSWAKSRFMNIVRNLRDWVISRQRFWGIPLPIWICSKCGHMEVIGSLEELEKLGGKKPKELHRPWVDEVKLKCPKCGGEMSRIPDVLDVWFDSGIAFYASLGYPRRKELWEELKPVDFIVEGHDQIRGWFFSLLRSGIIGFGRAPYRRVLVHGFMLDEQGREMHKSLGNYVEFSELISKVPRDVIRLWLLQNTVWEDLRFSWRALEQMQRDFTIIWNVFAFASMYMGLDRFNPREYTVESLKEHLKLEDLWILSRLNNMLKKYHEHLDNLEVHEAARLIRDFIVEDVSRWYLRLIRRRAWIEENVPEKLSAYATLYEVLRAWLLAAAPFIPHITEYLYQKMIRDVEEGPESVHLNLIPEPNEAWISPDLEEDMEIIRELVETAAAARMDAGLKLRRPIRRLVIAPRDEKVRRAAERLKDILLEQANAKSLEIVGPEFFEQLRIYKLEPVYSEIGPEYKKDTPLVLRVINERAEEIARALSTKGYYEAEVEGLKVRLETRHVRIHAEYPEWLKARETDAGIVAIDTRITAEEELEGLARELVRRIQFMRKELALEISDYIEVWVEGDDEIRKALEEMKEYIANETRAKALNLGAPPEDVYRREWDIDDKTVVIGIRRIE
ncbi:MAG: isoleucine--tRNA ligase [Desulfurococcales archaeon]|nr:isoleucine--tRNA ligase [Desulfurococcales archaeon]